MKKMTMILTALAVVAAVATANAQLTPRYQGDVEAGYSIGVGQYSGDRINIHTSHGVRINRYFFAGLGTGLDIYVGGGTDLVLPIFADLKGYLPVADRLDIFAGVDIGYSIGLTVDYSGFLAVPQLGLAYRLTDKYALTFGVGFTAQSWSRSAEGIRVSVNTNAITLKVGFQF